MPELSGLLPQAEGRGRALDGHDRVPGLGVVLYARERGRCAQLACRMAGSRVTLGLLIAASFVVASAIALDRFPEMTSDLLARLTEGPGQGHGAGHDMRGMDMKGTR